jgi:hypothetical protein
VVGVNIDRLGSVECRGFFPPILDPPESGLFHLSILSCAKRKLPLEGLSKSGVIWVMAGLRAVTGSLLKRQLLQAIPNSDAG